MLTRATLLFILLCSSLQSAVFSQDQCAAKFAGRIQDETGESLAGATVILSPSQQGAATDTKGEFSIEKICPGRYEVSVHFVGYKSQSFELVIEKNVTRTITLVEDVEQLSEVVIQEEAVKADHNQNFSVMSEKQLEATAGKSLGESLKEIPGVNTIQSGPGIFKPVIHGVHSQRVLILNHGIRQEGQQWGAEHAPEIDPFIASNILVVKDASSIKYGTDAIGGVIIVNPAELPDKPGIDGSLNTILQSNGRSGTFSGMLEGGLKKYEGWGWRLQGTAKRAGDYHAPDYSLTNTGVKELDFSAATGYHGKKFGFDIFFSRFQTEIGILKGTSIGNLDDLITAMETEPPQYTSDFSYDIGPPRQEVSHNLLKVSSHISGERGEWRFRYGFQQNNRKEFDIRRGDLSGIPAIDLKLYTHTLETEWESNINSNWSTCVGLTGMVQDNINIPGTKRIPFIPNFDNISGGVYGISKIIVDRWVIDVGARYDYRYYSVTGFDFKNTLYTSKLNFHNISATAGASLEIDKRQSWNINLSSAWRPPHVAELYSLGTHQSAAAIEYGLLLNDSTNEVMDIKDINFQNEQALKLVSSYQRKFGSTQFEVTGYVNYIFNYIYLRAGGITETIRGVYPYFRYNQTDALFLGADITASWQVTKNLKAGVKASLLRASDEKNDDYLAFIPSNRYEASVHFDEPDKFLLKDFFLESKVKYVAKQHRAPRTITPREFKEAYENDTDPLNGDHSNFDFMDAPDGYVLLNISSGFSIKREKVRYDFRVAAENLLNTSYREYTNRFRYYADDMGRNFILSFKYIF